MTSSLFSHITIFFCPLLKWQEFDSKSILPLKYILLHFNSLLKRLINKKNTPPGRSMPRNMKQIWNTSGDFEGFIFTRIMAPPAVSHQFCLLHFSKLVCTNYISECLSSCCVHTSDSIRVEIHINLYCSRAECENSEFTFRFGCMRSEHVYTYICTCVVQMLFIFYCVGDIGFVWSTKWLKVSSHHALTECCSFFCCLMSLFKQNLNFWETKDSLYWLTGAHWIKCRVVGIFLCVF